MCQMGRKAYDECTAPTDRGYLEPGGRRQRARDAHEGGHRGFHPIYPTILMLQIADRDRRY